MNIKVISLVILVAVFATLILLMIFPSFLSFPMTQSGFDKYPSFMPQKNWSIKYVSLFKQAINEKYNIDNEILNNTLIIISVTKGTQSDGFVIPFTTENIGGIHYIYKIGWALYKGNSRFDIKDDSGNDLTDQQILDDMKANLTSIFTVKNIISKEQAVNSCNPPATFPLLKSPWYSDNNNIIFDEKANRLMFECRKIVDIKENKCLQEIFSLHTGEKILSQETACYIT